MSVGVNVDVRAEAVEVSIARIEVKLDQALTDLERMGNDHETRIRSIEKWRYMMPAGIGVASNLAVEWLKMFAGGN